MEYWITKYTLEQLKNGSKRDCIYTYHHKKECGFVRPPFTNDFPIKLNEDTAHNFINKNMLRECKKCGIKKNDQKANTVGIDAKEFLFKSEIHGGWISKAEALEVISNLESRYTEKQSETKKRAVIADVIRVGTFFMPKNGKLITVLELTDVEFEEYPKSVIIEY